MRKPGMSPLLGAPYNANNISTVDYDFIELRIMSRIKWISELKKNNRKNKRKRRHQ